MLKYFYLPPVELGVLSYLFSVQSKPLEGVLRADSLKGNIEALASHYNYRQPLKVAVYSPLLPVNGSVYSFHEI